MRTSQHQCLHWLLNRCLSSGFPVVFHLLWYLPFFRSMRLMSLVIHGMVYLPFRVLDGTRLSKHSLIMALKKLQLSSTEQVSGSRWKNSSCFSVRNVRTPSQSVLLKLHTFLGLFRFITAWQSMSMMTMAS